MADKEEGFVAADRSDVIGDSFRSLSVGVSAVHDGFTYKAALTAVAPIVAIALIGAQSFSRSLGSIDSGDPFGGLSDSLTVGIGWLVVLVVAVVAAFLWFYVAIGMRTTAREEGIELSTGAIFTSALARMFTALGAEIILLAVGVGLFVVTLLLRALGGVPVLSVVVAVLTVPFMLLWIALALAGILGSQFVATVAATRPSAGPIETLRRAAGLVLVYPGPAIVMIALAGLIAVATYLALLAALYVATGVGIAPILDQMSRERQGLASQLVGIQVGGLFLMALFVPYAVTAASMASFERRVGDDERIMTAPARLLGLSWLRVQGAAAVAGQAAGRVKEKLDESAKQIADSARSAAEASDPPEQQAVADPFDPPEPKPQPAPAAPAEPVQKEPSPAPAQDPDPTQPPAATETAPATAFCAFCGTDNPAGYKFCRSCGKPAAT